MKVQKTLSIHFNRDLTAFNKILEHKIAGSPYKPRHFKFLYFSEIRRYFNV